MNKSIDLNNDPIKKLFSYYLYSSVIGMVIKSLHIMLDGIFVSNGVGPEALAAVNIFTPIVTAAVAVTLAIGVGGSTLASMRFGEEKKSSAQNIFIVSSALIFLAGLIFSVVFLFNPEYICRLLGANDAVLDYTIEYGKYICYFLPFYTLSTGIALFVRNDCNPKLAMLSMVVSAITNATLNYIFIFPMNMGLMGAAVATGISQIVSCLILLVHFTHKKGNFRIDFKGFSFKNGECNKSLVIGLPTFLTELSYAIVSIIFNKVLIRLGGEIAVSAFTIMIYVTTLLYNIYFGMGQGMQPIISFNYGAKKYDRVYESYHLAIKSGLIASVIIAVICTVFVKDIVMLFNRTNPELIEMAIHANLYIFFVMPFIAYNILVSVFFQSVGKAKAASVLSFLRGIVFIVSLIFILSNIFGLYGIWLVYPITEILSFVLCIIFMLKQDIITKIY